MIFIPYYNLHQAYFAYCRQAVSSSVSATRKYPEYHDGAAGSQDVGLGNQDAGRGQRYAVYFQVREFFIWQFCDFD